MDQETRDSEACNFRCMMFACAAHQDTQQEVQERLAAVLLFCQLRICQAQAEGVGTYDVVQPRVLKIALSGGRLDAVGRLKFGLRPQLQQSAACQTCAMYMQTRSANPSTSPRVQSTCMPQPAGLLLQFCSNWIRQSSRAASGEPC